MRCSDVARILPELVSGEVDQRTVRKAEEHIAGCSRCAAERDAYADALAALAGPREDFELPERLEVLVLPENRRPFMRIKPAFSLALASVAVIVLVLLSNGYKPAEKHVAQTPPPVSTERKTSVSVPEGVKATDMPVPVVRQREQPVEWTASAAVPESSNTRKHSATNIRKSPAPRQVVTAKQDEKTGEDTAQDDVPMTELEPEPKTMLVVAMQPPETGPNISITVTDFHAGEVCDYGYAKDASGEEREVEMRYSLAYNTQGRL